MKNVSRPTHKDFSALNASINTYLKKVKGLCIVNIHHQVREIEAQMKELILIPTQTSGFSEEAESVKETRRKRLLQHLPKLHQESSFRSAEESFKVIETENDRVWIPIAEYERAVSLYVKKPDPLLQSSSHGLHLKRLEADASFLKGKREAQRSVSPRGRRLPAPTDLVGKYKLFLRRFERKPRSLTPRFGHVSPVYH